MSGEEVTTTVEFVVSTTAKGEGSAKCEEGVGRDCVYAISVMG